MKVRDVPACAKAQRMEKLVSNQLAHGRRVLIVDQRNIRDVERCAATVGQQPAGLGRVQSAQLCGSSVAKHVADAVNVGQGNVHVHVVDAVSVGQASDNHRLDEVDSRGQGLEEGRAGGKRRVGERECQVVGLGYGGGGGGGGKVWLLGCGRLDQL